MSEKIHAHHLYQPSLLPKRTKQSEIKSSFKSLLEMEIGSTLTISKHAKQRLKDRNIHITDHSWNIIGKKVKEAGKKGVNDSLVILKDVTLVVNAPNQTVITAMGRNEAASQIFTNINGAIVIDE
jgi:flagellar operon protein